MSIYAIGDVQGCYESLQALIAQLPLTAEDRIWLCGDLVNRGPESAQVLRWAMAEQHRVVTVLGNHDLHVLAAAAGKRPPKVRDTYQNLLAVPDSETLLTWLASRPLLHREAGYVLVHAGLHPHWSTEQACVLASECEAALREDRWLEAWLACRPEPPTWSQDLKGQDRLAAVISILVGVRTLDTSVPGLPMNTEFTGPPALRPAHTEPWFALKERAETIVFGHWAALGLHLGDKHIGLDTGCVWGRELTAVRLDDRQVFSQPALERY